MKSRIFRGLSATALLLGLAISATACTGGSSSGGHDLEASGGQKFPAHTMGNLSRAVDSYSNEFVEKVNEDAEAEKSAAEKVHSYFTKDIDSAQRDELVNVFLMTAQIPGDVKIEFNEEDIEVNGDTATVRGNDIKVTVDGQLQSAPEEGGTVTLQKQGDEWLVSSVENPDGEADPYQESEITEGAANG